MANYQNGADYLALQGTEVGKAVIDRFAKAVGWTVADMQRELRVNAGLAREFCRVCAVVIDGLQKEAA